MKEWLKKHFIPHEGNDHRPHILRPTGARTVITVILAIELIAFLLPGILSLNVFPGLAAVLPAVLGELTNAERQTQDLPTLKTNPLLTRAAEMKAADMATKGYFAHTSPEGRTPWYWIELAGYRYQYAGENLAVNFSDSKDVTEAWLNSPSHKANIVKGAYTEMGTGIARGRYKGRNTVFVAQVYANPLPGTSATSVAAREPSAASGAKVLGAEAEAKVVTKAIEKPRLWQKLLASPRYTTDILLSVVFAVVAIALLLYTAIKMRDHDHDLVRNGLAVLAIIGAVAVANFYASYQTMVIEQSYHYALEDII